jgi:hypothetical protein
MRAMPKSANPDFVAAHKQLSAILNKHAKRPLQTKRDAQGNEVVVGPPSEQTRGKELWFGSVKTGKAYVSYHLMAVYAFPDLLDAASSDLKKRMQGKSCFNFRTPDPKLFKELDRLTGDGYRRFKQEGFIP